VSTLVAAVKALLALPRVAKSLDESPDLRAQFEASIEQVEREMNQVCFAVCRAIVAHALGHEPTTDDVAAFMDHAKDDPAFPHRAYRLIGELKKSADRRRRQFLAAMLFGHSFKVLPDDERDRVDMVVERMIAADAELLLRIADKQEPPALPVPEALGAWPFAGSGAVAFVREDALRIVPVGYWKDSNFLPEATTEPALVADRAALAALISLNCVTLGELFFGPRSDLQHDGYLVKSIRLTQLGGLVVQAINEVRPGVEARF
jgi:hypothetical protein